MLPELTERRWDIFAPAPALSKYHVIFPAVYEEVFILVASYRVFDLNKDNFQILLSKIDVSYFK